MTLAWIQRIIYNLLDTFLTTLQKRHEEQLKALDRENYRRRGGL